MAFPGIAECFDSENLWFGGITCTDGAGSSRSGKFAAVSDAEMRVIRIAEQRRAAEIGRFSFVAQLGYPSKTLAEPLRSPLVVELRELFERTKPDVVYTHNPADKHPTHIRVLVAVLAALRELPASDRPQQLLGCEGWRGLDWLEDSSKVVMDVSGRQKLASELNEVFESQIAGGKRYDVAVIGRRHANATFFDAHSVDSVGEACLAIDLTPLIGREPDAVVDFTLKAVDRFRQSVGDELRKVLNPA
jgi:LmbE family N-acetylglucosaminyl deacetylase